MNLCGEHRVEEMTSNGPDSGACSDFHGGKSFEAIGDDFRELGNVNRVISADVLDAWFDPSPRVIRKMRRFLPFLLRASPPIYAAGLVATIARARGVPEASIITGGGSSDLIFGCLPQLIDRGGKAIILDPMYSEHRHVLEHLIGAEVKRFALPKEQNFRIDTDCLIARVRAERPDLVVIVNPNSPTGQYWPRSEVIRFLNTIATSTWVVIDETYIEYVGRDASVEDEATKRPNVLVLKSMSKVYALSGARVGYIAGTASTVRRLARWLPPWGVSLPGQVAAIEALKDAAYYERQYRETHVLREELANALEHCATKKVYPSIANFVLVEIESSAGEIAKRMREKNVFVRNCDSMGTCFRDRFLRIAVRRRRENRRIVEAFAHARGVVSIYDN